MAPHAGVAATAARACERGVLRQLCHQHETVGEALQLAQLRRLHGVCRCSLTRISKFGHVRVLLCHQNAATIDTVPLERLRRLHRVRPLYLTSPGSPSAVGKMRASLSLQVATLVDAMQLDRLCRLH